MGITASKVKIIPNGVASPPDLPVATTREPIILFMGEVGTRKGVDVLLEALATPAVRCLEWRAMLGGDGNIADFEARAASLGLSERVEFLGWVGEADVASWMRRATTFALPSRAENQPVSIIEAMAHGLPVISTRVGGIPEQVDDGKTGLLVVAGDVPGLAGALIDILNNPARAAEMGAAGRARYLQRYSSQATAQAFGEAYRALCNQKRSRTRDVVGPF